MKLRLFIMFALFPFLHATSYSAKLVSCSKDQIVLKSQDSEFRVSLFNTKITKEEGWQKTCELLEDATSIRFEIDPSSKIEEPVPVYLFADDKLVQEIVRMLLEAIYEPTFSNYSHGFRPNRSCHTALLQLQWNFSGGRWFIEGDIKSFFDNINRIWFEQKQ